MTTDTNLTSAEGLHAYFLSSDPAFQPTNIALLTGGTANYVYRVTLADGIALIYKHAAPYLHSQKSFAFDPRRMDYESWALRTIPSALAQQPGNSKSEEIRTSQVSVHPVIWHSYDATAKLLCISDGGPTNLKDAYSSNPNLDVPAIGTALGTWIARLHMGTAQTKFDTDDDGLGKNNDIGVTIYRHSYKNLSSALKEYGQDAGLGEKVNEMFGSLLATDDECICHGDFWPGNVLVQTRGTPPNTVELSITDFEMTRRGTSATDVAQFAAEAFLLDRFRSGKGLLRAFLEAYVKARESGAQNGTKRLDREWVRRMAVHWATHVAFWPTRVEWADREGTGELVDVGVRVLRAVVDAQGDEWVDVVVGSELFEGGKEVWSGVLERV